LANSKLFKVFLILTGATPMLSTDFYLPALPVITEYFRTDAAATNMSMIVFTIAIAVCSLIWGPISDKYGRRPVIIFGGALYFAGSLLCAFAPSIEWFVIFRLLQGMGGGAAFMASTAFVKDVFVLNQQERILSIVQGMALIGPAIAPTIGAAILKIGSWHGIFILMTAMGAAIFAGALVIPETLRSPLTGTLPATFARLWVVFRNPRFATVVVIYSLPAVPIMAFINASPYIFQNRFGVSEQAFSLYFAASALAMMAGTFSYASVSRRIGRTAVTYVCLGVMAVCGALILVAGGASPFALISFIVPASFVSSMAKPISVYLGLNAQEGDTGSAASLIGFLSLMFASLGMSLLGLFEDYLWGVGFLYLLFGVVEALFFALLLKRV
jgi:DHA1 family bicyclomycin/chloramphenicol resistance-like MFS transporter